MVEADRLTKDERTLDRVLFFSDAVFAIAITLLALDIRLPDDFTYPASDRALLGALWGLWPRGVGYVISFMVIGDFWRAHLAKFRRVYRLDDRLLLLNLILLMIVAFIPFPTSVVARHGNLTSTVLYAGTMLAAGLASAAMWVHAVQAGLTTDDPTGRVFWAELAGRLTAPAIFAMSIGLSFVSPSMAQWSWLLVVPASSMARRVESRRRPHRRGSSIQSKET